MAIHKHADLLIAFASDNSLEFEVKLEHAGWTPCALPQFNPSLQYRIKLSEAENAAEIYLSSGKIDKSISEELKEAFVAGYNAGHYQCSIKDK